MPKLDLDLIEARANAATPGPWHYVFGYGFDWHTSQDGAPTANTEFACMAREDVPAMVARIRELETALKHARSEIVSVRDVLDQWPWTILRE